MIEPLVCVPSATGTKLAATAAADPLDEPPGVCARSCGLRSGPGTNSAYCDVTVLPRTTAPAVPQPAHDRRVPLRPPSGEDLAAEFGRHVGGVNDVLDRDGQAVERSKRKARRHRRVSLFGRGQRASGSR